MKILALDGSTKSTGWAIFNDTTLQNYGCITSLSTDLIKRIEKMQNEIDKILMNNSDITKLVMEEVRPDFNSASNNLQTHKALMFLQASITFLIHDKYPNITIKLIYPSSWRKQCGIQTGKGIKRENLKIADKQFVKDTFKIEVNDDIADAIGIGYGYINSINTINWES